MDHVAIMKSSWNLIPKILAGEKTIESRWYKTKRAPWDKVKQGDRVYFKNSGQPITAKANVARVLQFDNLTTEKIEKIAEQYGDAIGLGKRTIFEWATGKKEKKYCILIFLENAEEIVPFEIDKKGFGNAAAWLCVPTISLVVKNACQ